tara:strand:- start:362 stop:586 length:225 start_codon:yes stop_codon:yes gene_type:complete
MSTMSELDRQSKNDCLDDPYGLIERCYKEKQLRNDYMNGLISECDFKAKMNALYGLGIDMNGKIMNANLNGELS